MIGPLNVAAHSPGPRHLLTVGHCYQMISGLVITLVKVASLLATSKFRDGLRLGINAEELT
jgi:hypothetical protein